MRLKVEKLACGGMGLGLAEGKAVFVPFSAVGDVLDVEVASDQNSYCEAKISRVVEPSSERVLPRCPVYGVCGGCDWQHISYEAQLKWKREILIDSLVRIAKIKSPKVLDTLSSPREWNYRNRIQLHVSKDGKVGFYKPKSNDVVEFAECFIADEQLNRELCEKREEFRKRERGVGLRLTGGGSFAQVNSHQNAQLKKYLKDWLKRIPNDVVLELYAGSGNFTFEISKIAKKVIASDCDGRAVKIANEFIVENCIDNVRFYLKPSGKIARFMRESCDVVVVDPPRKGCPEAIEDIVRISPKSIIYVSCDPATLARDIASLISRGYELKKSLPIDMFPQTHHVESMNLLSRE